MAEGVTIVMGQSPIAGVSPAGMTPDRHTKENLNRRMALVRLGCLLMVAAAGGSAGYAWFTRPEQFAATAFWTVKLGIAYVLFIAAFMVAEGRPGANRRSELASLATEATAALYLVWLFPSFLMSGLVAVVAWQIAWRVPLRASLWVSAALSGALVAMKCVDQTDSMSLLILLASAGFQLFAIAGAHLARSESEAREELARVNSELFAAQVVLTEGAKTSERLRISRDLHDALGHSLTTMTLHLDVASRLADGRAAEHLQQARETASNLLDDVRSVVAQVRIAPVDLRCALMKLADGIAGLDVKLDMPASLPALDPARADAVLRCVQEVITNALRHSGASTLTIALAHDPDGSVHVSAIDDGAGGDFTEGQGLGGMRERLESLGGWLKVGGSTSGFRVFASLPVHGTAL